MKMSRGRACSIGRPMLRTGLNTHRDLKSLKLYGRSEMPNWNHDYPPEWDEPDEEIEADDDVDLPDDDDPKYAYECMTDLEHRYNGG
jgi:hypothetical protein